MLPKSPIEPLPRPWTDMMATFPRDEAWPATATDDEVRDLRRALASQPVIEQAKGMLMARHGCTADEAFQLLCQASMRQNRKIRDIACAIVESIGMQTTAAQRELVLAIRERAADGRDDAADLREAAANNRDADVEDLLRRALQRDQIAEARDRGAEQRDRAAEVRGACLADESFAAADRGQSAVDRFLAGADRDHSAGDRADLAASG